jgi:outer membrane biogenesis lipoprotein LolB
MTLPRPAVTPALRALRRALLLVVGLGVTACAAGTSRNPFAAPGTADTQLFVQVENQGFNDLRLYAISSRGSQSLGSVQGNTLRRLTLEWRQMEQLSFRMEVLAGRSYTTHTVSASPGDHVYLLIPSDPGGAFVQVR